MDFDKDRRLQEAARKEKHIREVEHEVLSEHFDANETAFLERELTQLRAKVLEVVFPELRGRAFAPKAADIAPSAETFAYKVYEPIGQAKFGSYGAGDNDRIDLKGREELGKVRPVTASYGFTLNELREAARLNVPLSELKARMAKDIVERGIDQVLAFGGFVDSDGNIPTVNLQGLVNNPDVTGLSILSGSFWDPESPSPTDMLDDLNKLVASIFTFTKQAFRANTLLLPSQHFIMATQTPYSNVVSDSVLTTFLKNNPGIDAQPWYQLDGAGAAGVPRAMAYQRDPMVLESVIPQEFEALPPEMRKFELITNCHARTGGVKIYQPTACKYLDFATS